MPARAPCSLVCLELSRVFLFLCIYQRRLSAKIKSPITNFSVTELFFYLLNKACDELPAEARRQNKKPDNKFLRYRALFYLLNKVRDELFCAITRLHCNKDETNDEECCYNCNSDVLLCVFLCSESDECVSDSTDADTI